MKELLAALTVGLFLNAGDDAAYDVPDYDSVKPVAAAVNVEPLKVEGEYVLTVKQTPVTIKAPSRPDLKFISWHYPTGAQVEIRNDRTELLVLVLPPGESMFWGDFGVVEPDGTTTQFTQRVVLLNGMMPRPPPEKPEPEDPPEKPEPEGAKKTTIVYEDFTPPPTHAEGAVNELREADEGEILFINAGVENAEGTTPAMVAIAVTEAKKVGLPALIIQKGDTVVVAEPLPGTKQGIIDRVKEVE